MNYLALTSNDGKERLDLCGFIIGDNGSKPRVEEADVCRVISTAL